MRRSTKILAAVVLVLPLLASCAAPDHRTGERTLTGAAVGAASGAAVGLITGGIVTKTLVGAVGGAAGGFAYDQIQKSKGRN